MREISPLGLILIGFTLVIVGFLIPFLMMAQIIQSGFILAFVSYIASLGGLIMGVIGAAGFGRERQDSQDFDDYFD
ncbi:MAG: hypothetical protein KJ063_08495 [Anaerolineae bacterium]|nr:hypothetical protein [Anaerolineae bacterium]